MKKNKKKNKFIHKNYNKLFYFMIFINIVVICLCGYTYKLYDREYKLNKELKNTKKEYLSLENSTNEYKQIKEDIDLVNGESTSIEEKYSSLNEKIETKKNSIDSYTNKIYDLNNKIKRMS